MILHNYENIRFMKTRQVMYITPKVQVSCTSEVPSHHINDKDVERIPI